MYYPADGMFGNLGYANSERHPVHPASDFLSPREMTIEEAEKEFNIKIKQP